MKKLRPGSWSLTALLGLSFLSGCVTDPVSESVEITLMPKERAKIAATVEIARVDRDSRPEAAAHADRMSFELMAGTDAWSRRFDGLESMLESRTWTKKEGELVKVRHSAVVNLDDLGKFFFDSPATIFVTADGDVRELAIYPGTGSRATREQEKMFGQRIDVWIDEVSEYYRDLARLYEHLELNPDRQAAISRALLGESAELSSLEEQLVDQLDEAMSEVMGVISLGSDDAYSMQYLSRLIYDTLPSSIEIVVEGVVLDHEHFIAKGGSRFTIPEVGLIEALGGLEERWITPDPLAIFLHAAATGKDSDEELEAMWSLENRSVREVPSAATIRAALIEQLERPRVYTLRWRPSDALPEAGAQ